MPSGKVHRWFEKKLLGKVYNVGKIMDLPARFVGPSHRKYLHDAPTVAAFAAVSAGHAKAALLHIALDNLIRGKKARRLEKLLEVLDK